MSQCHDPFDPTVTAPFAPPLPVGDQCHDDYGPDTGAVAAHPVHECTLVDGADGAVRVLHVAGQVDWATETTFLDHMCDECTDASVIVDLSRAALDSAGTGALLSAASRARQRGQHLVLVVTDAVELEVLLSLGVEDMFPLVKSESEAVAWFKDHPAPAGAR